MGIGGAHGCGHRLVYFLETILGRREHDLSRRGDLGIGYVGTDFVDVLFPTGSSRTESAAARAGRRIPTAATAGTPG